MAKISVVVNTLNEEKNLPRALSSIRDFADEIIVCDMYSEDKTLEVAKKFGAKIFKHKKTNFVEPARNFAINCAQGDYILVLDADEEIPQTLTQELKRIAKENAFDYILIPRKNIIFGKWIQHSRWWPDYLVRFFKKGKVSWKDKIHSTPITEGKEFKLSVNEKNAIIHHHYSSLNQYLERMVRYSQIQAEELLSSGYQFKWQDLLRKPLSEFLSRFFVGEGYRDSLHGLVLSFLQAFSEFLVYVRIWEKEGFREEENFSIFRELEKSLREIKFWLIKKNRNPLLKLFWRLLWKFEGLFSDK